MDNEISKALRALGVSQARIDELEAAIESILHRVKDERMITRSAPVKARGVEQRNELNKGRKPRRTLHVTYRPKATGPTVAQEIERIEGRLSRDIPPWQRSALEARLDGLRRSGKTYQEAASETLASIDRECGRRTKAT